MSPLQHSVPSKAYVTLRPSDPSTAFCPLYGPLSPLRPSDPSTVLCPLYNPLSPLRPSVLSTALCLLYGLSVSSIAIRPLLSVALCLHLRYFVSSMALYVSSTAISYQPYRQCFDWVKWSLMMQTPRRYGNKPKLKIVRLGFTVIFKILRIAPC